MNTGLMFSKASDEWATPQDFFDVLNAEFGFTLDLAATFENAKCARWRGDGDEWECEDWSHEVCWMNPPYSKIWAFMGKATAEVARGATVVALVPSRTDTRWWHAYVWDAEKHRPRPGVEVRFIKGRLKFGEGKNSAPFPSVVIIFRPMVSDRIGLDGIERSHV